MDHPRERARGDERVIARARECELKRATRCLRTTPVDDDDDDEC